MAQCNKYGVGVVLIFRNKDMVAATPEEARDFVLDEAKRFVKGPQYDEIVVQTTRVELLEEYPENKSC